MPSLTLPLTFRVLFMLSDVIFSFDLAISEISNTKTEQLLRLVKYISLKTVQLTMRKLYICDNLNLYIWFNFKKVKITNGN